MSKNIQKLFLVFFSFIVLVSSAFAQKSYNSADIDVDGTFMRSSGPSEADRLAQERRDLENKNEELIRKKIEDMRLAEERKMTEKIQQAMDSGFSNSEPRPVVQPAPAPVVQAAPVVTVAAAPQQTFLQSLGFDSAMMGLTFGYGDIKSKYNNMETDPIYRFFMEASTSENMSFGFSFLYSSLDLKASPGGGFWNYSRVEYERLSFDFYFKYLFGNLKVRLKPFIKVGLSYARTELKWANDSTFEFRTSFPSVFAAFGGDLKLSSNLGLVVQFNLEKNLTKDSTNPYSYSFLPYQDLVSIGKELRDSVFYSINLGLSYSF